MTTGEMSIWTNRLLDVRSMKNGSLRSQRMQNLQRDFLETYGWGDGIRNSNDATVRIMCTTIEHDYFLFV